MRVAKLLIVLSLASGCASDPPATTTSHGGCAGEVIGPVIADAGPQLLALDARVVAVKDEVSPPFVLLSVGSDDRVERGYHFSVYRGSEFVGKVVVERVLADVSGCRVLFTADGKQIQPGDSAATRLQ